MHRRGEEAPPVAAGGPGLMKPNGTRYIHIAYREALFVSLSVLGAWLFLHHDLLYLKGDVRLEAVPPESLLVSSVILYLFVRSTSLIAGLRVPPGVPASPGVCPACGQVLDDGTPEGAALAREGQTPRSGVARRGQPIVALKVLVDQYDVTARAGPRNRMKVPSLPALPVENSPGEVGGIGNPQNPRPVRRIQKAPWTPKNLG